MQRKNYRQSKKMKEGEIIQSDIFTLYICIKIFYQWSAMESIKNRGIILASSSGEMLPLDETMHVYAR